MLLNDFPRQPISLLGLDYALVIMRVQVNVKVVKPGMVTDGFAVRLCRQPEAHPRVKGIISLPNTTDDTPRCGDKRAIVAVAHSIAVIIYNMVSKGINYGDLGYLYFDERDKERVLNRTVHRIEALGYKVSPQVA
jgi:hypothetical protein